MTACEASTDYGARVESLRDELKKQKLDGFLAPIADEYQSEHLPIHAQRTAFLTGFTGSAGTAVVTLKKAAFFTDGRYTLQAQKQMKHGLFEIFDSAQKTITDWLKENAFSGQKIGFDPFLHTVEQIENYRKKLLPLGVELVPVENNPIDAIWKDRPPPDYAPVYAYDVKYAGISSRDKRRQIAEDMGKEGINAALITDSSSVAWLLNVRGGDVPFSPLPLSFAILRSDATVEWFIDPRKITAGLEEFLGCEVIRYNIEDFPAALRRLGESGSKVRVDKKKTSYYAFDILLKSGAVIDIGDDPCSLPKACKNPIEQEGMRSAHRRDGAALASFLCWLEESVKESQITEMQAAEMLREFRAKMPLFQGESFAAIAAAGANGAIIHYRPCPETNRVLEHGTLFLIDSGGQYLDGTTDVTRTIAIGEPSREMRDRFTRVLKGHIALASIIFPEGTTGAELEVLARQYLWSAGLDYSHGTGHGIGCYLNVHEGPQSISKRGETKLMPGMAVSNEPGYYKQNHYGIRIENIQLVIERPEIIGEQKMLAFEPLTLVPIDRKLIEPSLLLPSEKEWLNSYHKRVYQALKPLVNDNVVKWLEKETEPI